MPIYKRVGKKKFFFMITFVKLRCPNNVSGKVVANKETEGPVIVPDHQRASTKRRLSENMPENEQILGTQEKVLETQEEAQINRSLPGEMLETVFRHLPPKDLKVAVMVCKW